MASSGKTPNLGLNRWARTDGVCMDDFNADNAALDGAVGPLSVERIMQVVTAATAASVVLDLSGVDLTRYTALRFICRTGGIDTMYNDIGAGLVVDGGVTQTRKTNTGVNTAVLDASTYVGYAYSSRKLGRNIVLTADISGLPEDVGTAYTLQTFTVGTTLCGDFTDSTKSVAYSHIGTVAMPAGTPVTTLTVYASTTVQLAAGSEFIIYGVKR